MKEYINEDGTPFSKEQFIEKIKTNAAFSKRFGELGPIYGKQWRSWKAYRSFRIEEGGGDYSIEHRTSAIDQIQNLINDLKTNPDSRRLMVNAWNVGELDQMVLPPCHYGFQVYTRELSQKERWELAINGKYKVTHELDFVNGKIPTRAISLMFNMRSCDVPLGLPFNIASYGLLLEIIGKMVNMVPDELIASLGDAHIYKNQVNGIKEQLTREPYQLPTLIISDEVDFTGTIDDALKSYNKDNFKLVGYESHPSIKIPLSN
jgi:thymidylate synthase